ncbi:MAG: FMN-binding negative transcriptional regulator [Rhizobiales bacterium]|nr:FMN-binding negative transcriptional regulator [Hyphomicrobiales bacterium]
MYARDTSRESRPEVLMAAMRYAKFCAMVSTTGGGLHASHLPVIVEETGDGSAVLNGHLSRNNPHWRAINEQAETVAIFQGPHSYISPSWYETKAETGKVVPTWGYIAVHAHGSLEVIDDADWVREHVNALTNLHEASRPEPWAVSDAPDDYITVMLRGIVGVRLSVERLDGSWKLNQHRSEDDQRSTIAGLYGEDDPQSLELGDEMAEALASVQDESTGEL